MKAIRMLIQVGLLGIWLLPLDIRAQFQWSERIASIASKWPSGEPDVGLVLDTNDNCYVTGWFDGTNNFGGITLENQSTQGGSDIFVAKYNSSGVLQWVQQAGGTVGNVNNGRGIGVDNGGNVYALGGYYGAANFGNLGLAFPASGYEAFFLAKYNNAGAIQWVTNAAGVYGNLYGMGIAVDGAGNSYALAFDDADNGATLSFGAVDVAIPAEYNESTLLVKYDSNGNAKWGVVLGGSGEVYATKVAVDAVGNVYVRGTFFSTLTIGGTTLTVSPGSTKNAFIAKFDSSGDLIWVQQPTSGDVDEGGVAVDSAGNVCISGGFDNVLDFGNGVMLTNMAPNAIFGDAFVAEYNSAGVIQWAQSLGGTNGGFFWDVAVDGQNNVYPAGFLGIDAAVAKYSSNGTFQWDYPAGGPAASPVSSLAGKCAVDPSGNCYLAGWYQGAAAFGTNTLQPQGTWNFFLTAAALSVVAANPAIGFTATPTNGMRPLTVQFNCTNVDSQGNGINSWNWNFGDGQTSILQNPSHIYQSAGTFNPSLVATNSHNVAVSGLGPQIVVVPGPPVVVFQSPTNVNALPGNNLMLAVSASGAGPFSYQWQFDGTNIPSGIISTVAGGGAGDGGLATNAVLWNPGGVALDAMGNMYIVDTDNNRIREVGTNGVISTVAGNGIAGYSGDGGMATSAELHDPSGVALDASGNLYVADFENSCIRKVSANGIISTVAGGGTNGLGDGGMATNAELYGPVGVAVDARGNLFIVDGSDQRVRKVSTNGIISTVAGGGYAGIGNGVVATNAGLASPSGVAVDAEGNLYVAIKGNNRVCEVGTNGIINMAAGNGYYGYSGDGGAATNAALANPVGVALDARGNLFITDSYRIRKVDINGIISTVAGNGINGYSGDGGAATNAALANPLGAAVDASGNLFIADTGNFRIRAVDTNGIINTMAGNGTAGNDGYSGDGGAATNACLGFIKAVAVDTGGNLLVASPNDDRIRRVGANGIITTVAGNGSYGYSGDGEAAIDAKLGSPPAVAMDANGNLFIADVYNNRVREVRTNGIISTVAGNGIAGYWGDGGPATNAQLNYPSGVALDVNGNLYIADSENSRIREVGTNGIISTVAGNGIAGYSGDSGPATNAELYNASGVAVDAGGNLFIVDPINNRIRKVGTDGIISTVAGNGTPGDSGDGMAATEAELNDPSGVAMDAGGELFIAEWYGQRIREVGTNGVINTVAGNGIAGYFGDGGSAINAELYNPSGVAVDASGNVFIADAYNYCIRKVVFNPSVLASTLLLSKVNTGNAGTYDVVVSNAYGSVTSSVVNVAVALPQLRLSVPQMTLGNSNFTFLLSGPAGGNFVLQVSTNLVNWSSVSTSAIPVGGSVTLSNAISSYDRRFFRVHLQ